MAGLSEKERLFEVSDRSIGVYRSSNIDFSLFLSLLFLMDSPLMMGATRVLSGSGFGDSGSGSRYKI